MRAVLVCVIGVGCSSPTAKGPNTTPDAPAGHVDAPTTADAPTGETRHVLLDFDALADGVDLTNQFPEVSFASQPGCSNQTAANYDFGQSPPNYILTYFSCSAGSTAPIYMTFAKPVQGIKFRGIGINASGKAASMKLVHADQSTTTVDLVGVGDPLTPLVVDLGTQQNVLELDIIDVTDAYGVGYDDLEFEFPM